MKRSVPRGPKAGLKRGGGIEMKLDNRSNFLEKLALQHEVVGYVF